MRSCWEVPTTTRAQAYCEFTVRGHFWLVAVGTSQQLPGPMTLQIYMPCMVLVGTYSLRKTVALIDVGWQNQLLPTTTSDALVAQNSHTRARFANRIGCPGPGMGGSGDPDPVFDCNKGQNRRMSKFRRMPIFRGNLHLSDSDWGESL